MKTVLIIIKLICVILIITAILDVAYYILLELDLNFKGIQGWSHSILKQVDKVFGFIPDTWFKKQQVTFNSSGFHVIKNWWKADTAIFIFCGGAIWLIDNLVDYFSESTEELPEKKSNNLNE